MGHGLMARGTVKRKHNGTDITNWGIAKPTEAGKLTAVDPYTSVLATCAQTENPGFTATVGTITGTYPTGADGVANGALEITPNAGSGLFSFAKTFTADSDYSTIAGYTEDPQDLFDIVIWIARPDQVKSITVDVGVSSSATDKFLDRYTHTFSVESLGLKPKRAIRSAIQEALAEAGTPETPVTIEPEVHGGPVGPVVEFPAPATNPGWGHFTVERGNFARIGATTGRGWNTVTALRIHGTVTPGPPAPSALTISRSSAQRSNSRLTGNTSSVTAG